MFAQTDPAIHESREQKTSLAMCRVYAGSHTSLQKQEVEIHLLTVPPHTPEYNVHVKCINEKCKNDYCMNLAKSTLSPKGS